LYSSVVGRRRNASKALTVRVVLHRHRTPKESSERVDGRGRRPPLAQLGDDAVGADLVELVDRDEHARALLGREPEAVEHPVQHAPVVDADAAALESERVQRVERRDRELGLGARGRVADDVDVALHELPVTALLRALGTPDRRALNRPEDGRKLAAVAGVEPRERNSEVVPQAQIRQRRGVAGRTADRILVEPALEDVVRELLVVSADAGVQARVLLHHGGFDLVEPVRAIALADDGQDALAARLLCREEVAHAARRVHGCHGRYSLRSACGIHRRPAPSVARLQWCTETAVRSRCLGAPLQSRWTSRARDR